MIFSIFLIGFCIYFIYYFANKSKMDKKNTEKKNTEKKQVDEEQRLTTLARTTDDPKMFLKICREIDLDESIFQEALDRFRDKDFLYSVAGGIWRGTHYCIPGNITHTAWMKLVQIARTTNDPNEFLRISETGHLDSSIIEDAMDRFRDNDFLYTVAVSRRKNSRLKIDNPDIPRMALDRITDREMLWKIAINDPEWGDAIGHLNEEQKARFYEERELIYKDRCRHGQHDWVIISYTDTHNEESDIRGYEEVRQCRHCGRKESVDNSDAYGSKITVQDPGKYGS